MRKTDYITKKRIEAQEKKGREIGTKVLQTLFQDRLGTLSVRPTSIICGVDLACTYYPKDQTKVPYIPFEVEVKERNKSEYQLKQYPDAELKVSKLRSMEKANRGTCKLFYLVLLNNTTTNEHKAIIFDCRKIPWSELNITNWGIKKTQMDDNSIKENAPTYQIPLKYASRIIDITDIYNEWVA